MARSRKSSDKSQTGTPPTEQDENIEDAVVIEETASSEDEKAAADGDSESSPSSEPGEADESEETASDQQTEESEGASVAEATEHTDDPADADQAAAIALEEDQEADHAAAETKADASPANAEGEPETTPIEEPPKASEPPPPPAKSGSGAGGAIALIFGGIVAAAIGVFAARYIFPDGWPGQSNDTDAVLSEFRAASDDLKSTVDAQAARITELSSALESLKSEVGGISFEETDPGVADLRSEVTGELGTLRSSIDDASTRIADLSGSLDDLSGRLEQLELRPMPEGLDTSSLDAEIANFRSELAAAVDEARDQVQSAQEQATAIGEQAAEAAARREAEAAQAAADREAQAAAEADRLKEEAEAAAAQAARRAAVAQIVAAVENGQPYEEDLAALGGDVPEALAATAQTGVPTLQALEDAYPPAAREALDASIRTTAGDSIMERATAFLRVQSGARSLEPREGDDPDAVLSRAEASLRRGDIAAALDELAALPEAGAEKMSGWMTEARARLEAEQAAESLAQSLNEN